MPSFSHPLWLVGFRPFFILAMAAGMLLPVAWSLIFAGHLPTPAAPVSSLQWHAHEMLFGFGWAVLGGFLLTSTKNWVGVRGWHGAPLAFVAAAWLFERLGMIFGANWPAPLFLVSNNLFLVAIAVMIAATLIRHRKTDSYRDNLFFLVILPAFFVAKQLLLSPEHFALGTGIAIGLFRMAFLVMLERTLTQFMKGVFQAAILRHPVLDMAIKLLALLLVLRPLLPAWIALPAGAVLAALLLGRLFFWKPLQGLSRIDIGVMYFGYLAIVAEILIVMAEQSGMATPVGSLAVHVFSFGAMGAIIPAMMVRITKGHTGRKVAFDAVDRGVLWIMLLGFAFRIVGTQVWPGAYLQWIALAAACWFACFATLAWRYAPILLQPRIDGREH